MAAVSVSIDFAVTQMRREKLIFWDIYGQEGGGIIACQQSGDVNLEESIKLFEEACTNISGDRVKLKASTVSRAQKAKDPSARNNLDTWVTLNNNQPANQNLGLKANDGILFQLLTQVHELKLEIAKKELEEKYKQEEKGHPLDGIAHTVLTDPLYKMAIVGALNRIAGVSGAPEDKNQAPKNERPVQQPVTTEGEKLQANEKTLKAIRLLKEAGHKPDELLPLIAQYEKLKPGSVSQFIEGLKSMNITGEL